MTFEEYQSQLAAQARLKTVITWMMRNPSAVVEPHPSGKRKRDRLLRIWEVFLRDHPEAKEWLR